MPKFCPNCGTPVEENAAFCTRCGAKLNEVPASAAMTPAKEEEPPKVPPATAAPVAPPVPAPAANSAPQAQNNVPKRYVLAFERIRAGGKFDYNYGDQYWASLLPSLHDDKELFKKVLAPLMAALWVGLAGTIFFSKMTAVATVFVILTVAALFGVAAYHVWCGFCYAKHLYKRTGGDLTAIPNDRTAMWRWLGIMAAALVLLVLIGFASMVVFPAEKAVDAADDAAALVPTAAPAQEETEPTQEENAPATPEPAPEPTPEPAPEPADSEQIGDRMTDAHVLTYTNTPWYGAWKNVDDGSIMVWESYKVWANEGYTQQPDGSYVITLGDPRDTDVTFSEYYRLSPDYNHLEKYAPDDTLLAEYVTPAYADIKDALPEDWWGYYTFVTGDYDRTQDTGYLTVDAFQVGGSPYGNAAAVDGGRYTIMQGDGMDSWQVTLACFENDGVQYLEFLDETGGSLGLYALEP